MSSTIPDVVLVSPAALRESAAATRRRAAELRQAAQTLRATARAEHERAERDTLRIIDQLAQRAAPPVFDPRPFEPPQSWSPGTVAAISHRTE